MPPLRMLVPLLVAALSAPLQASWHSPAFGSPVVEVFRPQQTGGTTMAWTTVQDPQTGVLIFGCATGLLAFDGANWRQYSTGDSKEFRSLSIDAARGRMWVGGTFDLGFFDYPIKGELHYVSLRDRLPFPVSELRSVWGCHADPHGVDFVAYDRVLRWNGTQFQVWSFPTKSRLCPVMFEGALWFHHGETGLYRMGAEGPEKIADRAALPHLGQLFMLHRQGGTLIGGSNAGLTSIEANPRVLSHESLNRFTLSGLMVGGTALPSGYIVSTLKNGVGIVSSDGSLVQILDQQSGVTGRLSGHFLDRDGDLWIRSENRIVRVPSVGATSRIHFPGRPDNAGVASITAENDQSLWVATGQDVFHVVPGTGTGGRLQVTATPLAGSGYASALMTEHGLLGFRFDGVEQLGREGKSTTATSKVADVVGALELRSRADHYLLFTMTGLTELIASPTGEWSVLRHDGISATHPYIRYAAEDAAGNIWAASDSLPPYFLRRTGDRFELATPPELSSLKYAIENRVFARPADTLLLAGRKLFLAETGGKVRDLQHALPGGAVAEALSRDGTRLYARIHRPAAPRGFTFGIGQLEIDAQGRIGHWREFIVPGLASVEKITSMAVTSENGDDILWIGGSDGLLQASVAELKEWQPPGAPAITLLSNGQPAATTEFAFQHQLDFQLRAHEVSLRPAIRFQTKLGDDTAPWGEVTERTSFEFSNLREGAYSFAVRTVNPLGQTSPPVVYAFTILPPWYRSPWAYAVYLALFCVGTYGAVRIRERHIRERNAELEKLVTDRTAELVKANAAKDEFLASMSHEIRNPMNGVVGLSAAIDAAPLSPDGRHRFELLRHCAAHLATLLEDILDFSRLQSGHIELHEQPFAPAELLESVEAIAAADSAAAGMPVRSAMAPNMPAHLMGDARRIRQVLLNFVTNALKYAGRGEVEITAWAKPAGDGRMELTFAVSDEGPGIPYAEQDRVFAKFERGSAARGSRIPGTGMGLAVCRQLAETMGGRVWLESEPGQGSTFYFSVPLRVARGIPTTPPSQSALRVGRKLALVVDDEEYNRIAHAAHLERLGFKVHTAADGASAVASAAAGKYDVVFIDYDMPDVKGPDLARRLREMASANGRQPFLIAATAYTTVEKRTECLEAGMDAFLGKPVSEERLREAISGALDADYPVATEPTPVLQVEEPAAAYAADPWENLRVVARNKGTSLRAEIDDYRRTGASELESIHEGIVQRRTAAARTAHQLAGRLGFIKAAEAAQLALDLEQALRDSQWEEATELEARLAAEWAGLQEFFNKTQDDRVA